MVPTKPSVVRTICRLPITRGILRVTLRVSWLLRFYVRKVARRLVKRPSENSPLPQSLSSLPGFYINLERRKDRLRQIERELSSVGLASVQRFPGISHEIGILGCTLSHAEVMKLGQAEDSPFIVCEDDVEFLGNADQLLGCIAEFLGNPDLDVLCLAFNLGARPHRVSSQLWITNDTQTASCYVVKPRAVSALEAEFR